MPWDLFDRLFVPLVCCHAAAVVLSFVLNVLRISQVSSFGLFVLFALLIGGSILFYHHLKVGGHALLGTLNNLCSHALICVAVNYACVGWNNYKRLVIMLRKCA